MDTAPRSQALLGNARPESSAFRGVGGRKAKSSRGDAKRSFAEVRSQRSLGEGCPTNPVRRGPALSKVAGMSILSSGERKPVTVVDFLAAKQAGKRLTMLTAYDYTLARLLDAAGIDGILVGDSLGMVMQGHDTSLSVSMTDMLYHTRLV